MFKRGILFSFLPSSFWFALLSVTLIYIQPSCQFSWVWECGTGLQSRTPWEMVCKEALAELLEAEGVLMLFSSNLPSFKAWQKEVKAVSHPSLLGTVLAGSATLQEGTCGWWNEKETQIRESMSSTHFYNWVFCWGLTPTFYKA